MLDDSYANCGSNCCGRQIPSQKNSKIARIVGTGYQKHDQLFALNEILSVYEVRVNDVSKDRIEKYVVEMSKKVSPRIRAKPNLAELLKENARAHNRVRYKR
jgi:ornithine cyclodeaminase/alanine dehydrogenase-like protein (mu-crystallin family)